MSITSTELESYSGDDYALSLVVTDSLGAVVDISAYTIYLTIKTDINDLDADAEISLDVSGVGLTDPTNGKTVITIPHGQTEALSGIYKIDVKYKDGSGKIGTILNGRMNFVTNVTERASI